MEENLINIIKELRLKGDYGYILAKYVDKHSWIEKVEKNFPNDFIENSTDFNYSVCFTVDINISNTDEVPAKQSFRKYLEKNKCFYRIQIEISAIAPYAVIRYVRYVYNNGDIKMEFSSNPFIKEHIIYGIIAEKFLIESKLTILSEDLLSIIIPGVSLEMKESNATVYNCLFDDEYWLQGIRMSIIIFFWSKQ